MRSAASAELTRQVEKSTPSACERVSKDVMDQGTEKWLLTSRWMLWLAPGGLRGGQNWRRTTKAASHNLSFSVALGVLGLRIVVQDVAASFSDALSRQPSYSSSSLRRLWLGVAAQASGTSLSDVSTTQLPVHTKQLPSRSEEYRKVLTVQCEFCVSRGFRTSWQLWAGFETASAPSLTFQRHFCQLLRQWQTISRRCGVPGAGCCGSGAQTMLRHSPPPPPSARAKSP